MPTEGSLKILKGVIDTAFEDGRIEGKMDVVRKMKQRGFSKEDISGMTGLSEGEIENL